jgi:hypothetical protein
VTDELIEVMARAIAKRCWYNVDVWEKIPTQAHSEYRDLARAALQAIEESGTHVVVPTLATHEMTMSMSKAFAIRNTASSAYAAMLDARPKVPHG